MKSLVLCGGIPQVELINKLKKRGIYTILLDMNEKVLGRAYADEFYPISVFDIEKIKKIALDKKVDFIVTACADQVLLIQAKVSEELGLPCYISYETAKAVSDKEAMKRIFIENNIPTSKYKVMSELNIASIENFKYPLIVKPVDSYSSKGVKKVFNEQELAEAFVNARGISRSKRVIVEEYVEGNEITIDAYVENGEAHILSASNIYKISNSDKFIICRTKYPADINKKIIDQIDEVANDIAKSFNLKNSPMLIQLIENGEAISVIEFCARTGGGEKFKLIKNVSKFDVIDAIIDLTLGKNPHVEHYRSNKQIINEFLYGREGIFDHLEGFEALKTKGIIKEYFQLREKGEIVKAAKSSSERIAYITVEADNKDELFRLHEEISKNIKVCDINDEDILRHDIIEAFNI